ncbi:hypothetical protein FJTKL_15051 [Diaporthe vaccinii]|uniref:Uncharacterized protein n=1 Tax=Diaporthe vaccinii TaxID=105482 RepID=A0ABR4E6D2_9PEZI
MTYVFDFLELKTTLYCVKGVMTTRLIYRTTRYPRGQFHTYSDFGNKSLYFRRYSRYLSGFLPVNFSTASVALCLPPLLQLLVAQVLKRPLVATLARHPLEDLPIRHSLGPSNGVHRVRLALAHQQRPEHSPAVIPRHEGPLDISIVRQPPVAREPPALRVELRDVVHVQVVALDVVLQAARADQRLGVGVVARQEGHVLAAVAEVGAHEARVDDTPHARGLGRVDDVLVLPAPALADEPGGDEGDGLGAGEDAHQVGRVVVVEHEDLGALCLGPGYEAIVDETRLVAGENELVLWAGEGEGVGGGYAANVAVAACQDVLGHCGDGVIGL